MLVEEALGDRAQLGREGGVAVEHDLASRRERIGDLVLGDRSHTVVVGQTLDAQETRLEAIPAPRQLVPRAYRFDQGGDRLIGGLVRQVAGGQPGRIAAQAIVDRLVGQKRVEQEGAGAQAGRKRIGDRLGGGAPHITVGQNEATESYVEGDSRGLSFGAWRFEATPASICAPGSPLSRSPRPCDRRTSIAEVSSSNRRDQAEAPVTAFSARIFSSGSESRWER